jgi:hypothetical protein
MVLSRIQVLQKKKEYEVPVCTYVNFEMIVKDAVIVKRIFQYLYPYLLLPGSLIVQQVPVNVRNSFSSVKFFLITVPYI